MNRPLSRLEMFGVMLFALLAPPVLVVSLVCQGTHYCYANAATVTLFIHMSIFWGVVVLFSSVFFWPLLAYFFVVNFIAIGILCVRRITKGDWM